MPKASLWDSHQPFRTKPMPNYPHPLTPSPKGTGRTSRLLNYCFKSICAITHFYNAQNLYVLLLPVDVGKAITSPGLKATPSMRGTISRRMVHFVEFIYSPVGYNSPPTQVVLSPMLSRTVTPSLKFKRGGRGESSEYKKTIALSYSGAAFTSPKVGGRGDSYRDEMK